MRRFLLFILVGFYSASCGCFIQPNHKGAMQAHPFSITSYTNEHRSWCLAPLLGILFYTNPTMGTSTPYTNPPLLQRNPYLSDLTSSNNGFFLTGSTFNETTGFYDAFFKNIEQEDLTTWNKILSGHDHDRIETHLAITYDQKIVAMGPDFILQIGTEGDLEWLQTTTKNPAIAIKDMTLVDEDHLTILGTYQNGTLFSTLNRRTLSWELAHSLAYKGYTLDGNSLTSTKDGKVWTTGALQKNTINAIRHLMIAQVRPDGTFIRIKALFEIESLGEDIKTSYNGKHLLLTGRIKNDATKIYDSFFAQLDLEGNPLRVIKLNVDSLASGHKIIPMEDGSTIILSKLHPNTGIKILHIDPYGYPSQRFTLQDKTLRGSSAIPLDKQHIAIVGFHPSDQNTTTSFIKKINLSTAKNLTLTTSYLHQTLSSSDYEDITKIFAPLQTITSNLQYNSIPLHLVNNLVDGLHDASQEPYFSSTSAFDFKKYEQTPDSALNTMYSTNSPYDGEPSSDQTWKEILVGLIYAGITFTVTCCCFGITYCICCRKSEEIVLQNPTHINIKKNKNFKIYEEEDIEPDPGRTGAGVLKLHEKALSQLELNLEEVKIRGTEGANESSGEE